MKHILLAVCLVGTVRIFAAPTDYVSYVRPEMGTVNTRQLSNGNLYPSVGRPWGMQTWSPMTNPGEDGCEHWFYDYTGAKFFGLRLTHQLSPWIGDYASLSILPVNGKVAAKRTERFSWYSHKAETMAPNVYSVYLADSAVTLSLAPTVRAAVLELDFSSAEEPGLIIDPFKGGEVSCSGRRVVAKSVTDIGAPHDCAPIHGYFVLDFDQDIISSEKLADGAILVRFAARPQGPVVIGRCAMSFISPEQAVLNLREVEGKTLSEVTQEGKDEWNRLLSRVEVQGKDMDQLRTFYTCLYRMLLCPKTNSEINEKGERVHWSPADGSVRSGAWFSGMCYWDTFRALLPFVNRVYPEMSAQILEGLVNCWREYGWLPEISAPGLTDCMIGNNVASFVADAYEAGVTGNFDYNELLTALVHETTTAHPKLDAIGRKGAAEYLEKGYVPRDIGINESAARTLEYAYDDACVAQLAQRLGKTEIAAVYQKRSENWRKVFDPAKKLACGRNADGSFNAAFNPFAWGGDFTEGCSYHYTWSVFQNVPGLIEAMGGKAAFEKQLDAIFEMPPTADWSAYGLCIHEIREMQIMHFGQYAHGNQPIQHMIYLYDWTDHPEKAGFWARKVMNRLYRPTPDGYCGDEDNGQTSAWYVWSALGMYPVSPALGDIALGRPLFDEAVIHLPTGQKLTLQMKGTNPLPHPFVSPSLFKIGGTITWPR